MRVHLALSVADMEASVAEYTRITGAPPVLVIAGEYALWKTPVLNLSIRRQDPPGQVRHVGFERADTPVFKAYRDVNGLLWETFTEGQQLEEIRTTWPDRNPAAPQRPQAEGVELSLAEGADTAE